MTEQFDAEPDEVEAEAAPSALQDDGPAESPVRAEPTGHPAVDEVLRSLESLGETPVDEHLPIFEQAHEALRGALDDAGEPEAGEPGA